MGVVLCVGISACSDDDDEDSTSLKGTTWNIVKYVTYNNAFGEWIDEYDDAYADWYDNVTKAFLTFNSDGTVTSNWNDEPYKFIKYSYDGTNLTLNFSNDDCTTGTFVINGNTATYTCYWYDYYYEWSDKDDPEAYEIWTLEKQ